MACWRRYAVVASDSQFREILGVLGAEAPIVRVRDLTVLVRMAETGAADIAIVNSAIAVAALSHEFSDVVNSLGVPFVLYCDAHVSGVRSVLDFAQRTTCELAVARGEGQMSLAAALERCVVSDRERVVGSAVVCAVEAALAKLPEDVRCILVDMYRSAGHIHSPNHLAYLAGVGRRSLDRHVRLAGFHSSRLLVASGRVTRAYRLIHASGVSLERAARRAGYGGNGCTRTQRLERDALALTGVRPSSWRRALQKDAFVVAMRERLVPGHRV